MRAQEFPVRMTFLEEPAVDGESERKVASRPWLKVEICLLRELGTSRIDNYQAGSAALRFLEHRHEMDAAHRGIDTPEHDEPGFRVVRESHPRHLAVKADRSPGRRHRAHRAQQTRGAESAK